MRGSPLAMLDLSDAQLARPVGARSGLMFAAKQVGCSHRVTETPLWRSGNPTRCSPQTIGSWHA